MSPDPRFERRDLDLVHRLIVGVPEATLGARIEVPTIDGVAENLEIPAGTQPGSIFTLSGRGMPQLGRRARGDMHVVVDVVIPEVISDEEADLVRRWAELRARVPTAPNRRDEARSPLGRGCALERGDSRIVCDPMATSLQGPPPWSRRSGHLHGRTRHIG